MTDLAIGAADHETLMRLNPVYSRLHQRAMDQEKRVAELNQQVQLNMNLLSHYQVLLAQGSHLPGPSAPTVSAASSASASSSALPTFTAADFEVITVKECENLDDYKKIETVEKSWTKKGYKTWNESLKNRNCKITNVSNEKLAFLFDISGDPVSSDDIAAINEVLKFITRTLHNNFKCLRLCDSSLWKAKQFAIVKTPDWTRHHFEDDLDMKGKRKAIEISSDSEDEDGQPKMKQAKVVPKAPTKARRGKKIAVKKEESPPVIEMDDTPSTSSSTNKPKSTNSRASTSSSSAFELPSSSTTHSIPAPDSRSATNTGAAPKPTAPTPTAPESTAKSLSAGPSSTSAASPDDSGADATNASSDKSNNESSESGKDQAVLRQTERDGKDLEHKSSADITGPEHQVDKKMTEGNKKATAASGSGTAPPPPKPSGSRSRRGANLSFPPIPDSNIVRLEPVPPPPPAEKPKKGKAAKLSDNAPITPRNVHKEQYMLEHPKTTHAEYGDVWTAMSKEDQAPWKKRAEECKAAATAANVALTMQATVGLGGSAPASATPGPSTPNA
ncbi:hypothetical protein BKA70DRAFT_1437540 [Coprinopsis sp. MPI-PUGE-AT-0042]|nr:hypothetical protein BKA70DRAFT_1437540 [Coprinopsis sp. MPI-PUGE-AT-0042]